MTWLQTYTGKKIDFNNVTEDDICIEDIAEALSKECRFGGHCKKFYSVAQHSYLTALIVTPDYALEALLHDATEAYLKDIPSPLKALLPDYKAIEKRLDAVIRRKFGLPEKMSGEVKKADLVMLATERNFLLKDDGSEWPCLAGVEPHPTLKIVSLQPFWARKLFFDFFYALTVRDQIQTIARNNYLKVVNDEVRGE